MRGTVGLTLVMALICLSGLAQEEKRAHPRGGPLRRNVDEANGQTITLTVDGQERSALVFLPSKAPDARSSTKDDPGSPVVFAFHGHHGKSQQTARKFQIQKLWPEAIVVYPQGLPTSGITDPQGKSPGWQKDRGDYADRDLKFFDALLEQLKADHSVDAQRVYAMGHSNGGMFTYLLWAERGDQFAAFAPVAATAARLRGRLKPKPAMHFAGKKDPLVPFAMQQISINFIKQLNGCGKKFDSWTENCRYFASDNGTPFVEYIHDGGHEFPDDAGSLIVKFFKQQSLKPNP
jgi:polyhydroxybutyrate depolymerase